MNADQADTKPPKRRGRRIALWVGFSALSIAALTVAGFEGWRWWIVPADAPVVGVSFDTAWHGRFGVTSKTYETALARVGGRVRSIAPGDSPEQVLDQIDALVLAGGGDVDPARSGADPALSTHVDRDRDAFELAMIKGALQRRMPILGVCRGLQILNVAHGGSLRSLKSEPGLIEAHGFALDRLTTHSVVVEADSRLAAFVGPGERTVNSYHAQAIDRLADPLHAAAIAPDGVIEAVEAPDHPFVIGVQWHPEILSISDADALAIFDALISEARRFRDGR